MTKRKTPVPSAVSVTPAPIVTNMSALQTELETAAAELRTAELAVVHATAMRDTARTRHLNASLAWQSGFEQVTQAAHVVLVSTRADE